MKKGNKRRKGFVFRNNEGLERKIKKWDKILKKSERFGLKRDKSMSRNGRMKMSKEESKEENKDESKEESKEERKKGE